MERAEQLTTARPVITEARRSPTNVTAQSLASDLCLQIASGGGGREGCKFHCLTLCISIFFNQTFPKCCIIEDDQIPYVGSDTDLYEIKHSSYHGVLRGVWVEKDRF